MSVDSAPLPPLEPLVRASTKRTFAIFASSSQHERFDEEERRYFIVYLCFSFRLNISFISAKLRLSVKINDEYKDYKQLPTALVGQQGPVGPARPKQERKTITAGRESPFQFRFIPLLLKKVIILDSVI